jgi:anti-sigma regulatory factor (Ser/Thr protein kinase)
VSEPSEETVPLDIIVGDCQGEHVCPSQRDWPLSTFQQLGPLPSAVSSARHYATAVLLDWGLASLSESVELIVSELVTNAMRASGDLTGCQHEGQLMPHPPPVRMWLRSDRKSVLIQVWDGSELMPTRQDVDLEAESGRGLLLVEVVSTEWGSCAPTCGKGKLTWAIVADG